MAEKAPPTLPDEVAERLAAEPEVSLAHNGVTSRVHVAPLHRQVYVLVPNAFAAGLLDDCEAELRAQGEGWSLRTTGRLVAGRTVASDPRRGELAHWLPEGRVAQQLNAARFYPEHVDYTSGDRRANGPVPGAAIPGAVGRWSRMALRDFQPVYVAGGGLCWLALLVRDEKELVSIALVAIMILIGMCTLAGVVLLHRAAAFDRWRRSVGGEGPARELVEGWLPARAIPPVGWGFLVGGLTLNLLLLGATNAFVAGVTFLAGGAPFVAPVLIARHLSESDEESGG